MKKKKITLLGLLTFAIGFLATFFVDQHTRESVTMTCIMCLTMGPSIVFVGLLKEFKAPELRGFRR